MAVMTAIAERKVATSINNKTKYRSGRKQHPGRQCAKTGQLHPGGLGAEELGGLLPQVP